MMQKIHKDVQRCSWDDKKIFVRILGCGDFKKERFCLNYIREKIISALSDKWRSANKSVKGNVRNTTCLKKKPFVIM